MPLERLLRFFDFVLVLIRTATLVFQTLTIGGVGFLNLVLREAGPPAEELGSTCRRWIRRAAAALVVTQILYLVTNLTVLIRLSGLSFGEAIGANLVYAAGLSIAGAISIVYLSSGAAGRNGTAMLLPAGLILVSSVMTSHAVGRMEHRVPLAMLTWLHQASTAVWIGGLPFLLFVICAARTPRFLQRVTRRFSRLALVSVSILAAAGIGMGLEYVGSWSAFYGTAYGAMLGGKFALFALLLALGGMNFLAVRAGHSDDSNGVARLRSFCEAEIGIGLTVLLAAASMTSQPPAADLIADRLTPGEIVSRLTPRWPTFTTPAAAQIFPAPIPIQAGATPADPTYAAAIAAANQARARAGDEADIAWSEYNHHWAGLVVVSIGLLSFLARTRRVPFARNWPLLFIGLAIFLFFRADPETWPLGSHRSFLQSWLSPEDMQHRLFVLLLIVFAIFEWRVQTGRIARQMPALVFPAVCLAGGAALLAHSHSFGNVKEELFAELSHLPIAILGVMAGWSRWLELRLPAGDRAKSAFGWIWPVCFVLVGAILLNYREA
ncbi:MAG TPA: CopD family protein [Candidatus Nitrosotalea sp.]|nr:CopD family protein [Candidatus Nitrosotalea sp.]